MNRALRAATMGVLLLSPVVLSACSAGQVTQTATQERDKTGAQAQVGDITLAPGAAEPPRRQLRAGDDAELQLAIVNGGTEDDTLVGGRRRGLRLAPRSRPPRAADGRARRPRSASSSASRGSAQRDRDPGRRARSSSASDDATVTLTDLDEGLTTGQYLEVTLTFEKAGEVTIPVTVANPDEQRARGEAFDFHEEESGAERRAERPPPVPASPELSEPGG